MFSLMYLNVEVQVVDSRVGRTKSSNIRPRTQRYATHQNDSMSELPRAINCINAINACLRHVQAFVCKQNVYMYMYKRVSRCVSLSSGSGFLPNPCTQILICVRTCFTDRNAYMYVRMHYM